MRPKKIDYSSIIWVLIGLVLAGELIRDMFKEGDFIGYVQVGNQVLAGRSIYENPLINTWPPFFSIFSVPIALGDRLSSVGVRFVWLLGSIFAMGYIVMLSIRMCLNEAVSLSPNQKGTLVRDFILLIPLLVMLRFIMENLANIQINIYMLLLATQGLYFFIKKQHVLAGLLFALSISLKVYTIFFFLYFIFKREWKISSWILVFIVLINSLPILVFGFDQTVAYYQQWIYEIAPGSFVAQHKNQSVLGLFLRVFTASDTGINLSVNLLSLQPSLVKQIWLCAIAIIAIYPMLLFRRKLSDPGSLSSVLEYSVIFTLVPLLSPLSWKPYFIFLYLPYLITYYLLFRVPNRFEFLTLTVWRTVFFLSILLTVFSTEAFVGIYFSDVLETFSIITVGTILLLVVIIFLIKNQDRFDSNLLQPAPRQVDILGRKGQSKSFTQIPS